MQFIGKIQSYLIRHHWFKWPRLDQLSWAIIIWTFLLALVAISGVITQRGLYADGSHFFLRILFDGLANDLKHQRLFVNYLNQFLVQIARNFPGTNYAIALALFDLPLFFWPVILPAWAAWILRRNQPGFSLLILISQTAIVLPSLIFAINPGLVFFSLLTLNLALILNLKKTFSWTSLGLLILAGIFFQSHETTLVLMPVLVGLVGWQFNQNRQLIWLVLTGFYLANWGYSYWWQQTHPIQEAGLKYSSLLFELVKRIDVFTLKTSLLYSVGLACLGVVRFGKISLDRFWPKDRLSWLRLEKLVYSLVCLIVIFLGIQAVLAGKTWPSDEFKLRVLITPGAIGLTLAAFLPTKFLNQVLDSKSLVVAILTLTLGASFWQFNHSLRWYGFLSSVSEISNQTIGSERINLAKVKNPEYEWDWTWPSIAIIVQKGLVKHIFYPVWLEDAHQNIRLPNILGDNLETPYAIWGNQRFLDLSKFHYEVQSRL